MRCRYVKPADDAALTDGSEERRMAHHVGTGVPSVDASVTSHDRRHSELLRSTRSNSDPSLKECARHTLPLGLLRQQRVHECALCPLLKHATRLAQRQHRNTNCSRPSKPLPRNPAAHNCPLSPATRSLAFYAYPRNTAHPSRSRRIPVPYSV